ncbi:MAG: cytochrome c nitrite reductase small subunit [Ignavibacteria bacterium]|nr:cytochrome c nitrite reductase small subunit [Ignavibacteria bacterium]MBT8382382.1 cytochrome c nitrite reductase small subunit [Ignavibacteria bacterium]MBT8391832.1 cytochrome c nitrite reductase small subunit [Ignavibacteria bacterium]NNJ51893.1 cytochrome c nitrite reductase small subunit [Ignavibacteriaceae bacterium]NNL21101.1 cytochrome c nitrite reductase small subunit [Ignavibacteriaceae bacterium]
MPLMKFLKAIAPPATWRFVVVILLGIMFGLIIFTLHAGRATSYLSDEPEACVNCHVMTSQYATWERGSHGRVTTCNDCHVPNNNAIRKFLFKASDGLRHSYMFTFRLEPQVIRIKQMGKDVVQENCVRCHQNALHPVSVRSISNQSIYEGMSGYCWNCHRETPHGRVHSLTSAPYARIPKFTNPYPDWIKNSILNNN